VSNADLVPRPRTLTYDLFSVHRFSHATMPFFNLFKKFAPPLPCPDLSRSPDYAAPATTGVLAVLVLSRPAVPNTDAAARESGLVLAYPLYSPTYAAGASYMRGTYRENGTVLTGAMAFWLVRILRAQRGASALTQCAPRTTVLRALESQDAPDDACAPPGGLAEACVPRTRIDALILTRIQVRSRVGTASTSSRSRTTSSRRSGGSPSPRSRAAGPVRAPARAPRRPPPPRARALTRASVGVRGRVHGPDGGLGAEEARGVPARVRRRVPARPARDGPVPVLSRGRRGERRSPDGASGPGGSAGGGIGYALSDPTVVSLVRRQMPFPPFVWQVFEIQARRHRRPRAFTSFLGSRSAPCTLSIRRFQPRPPRA
jgi:hypothetical protein